MKTSDIEIRDLLSVLSVVGVEHRIGEVPGVESVTVNHAAGLATVRYDETRLNVTEIKSAVRQGEYEPATAHGGAHEGHTSSDASPAAAPKSPPEATGTAPAIPVDRGQSGTAKPGAPSAPLAAAKPAPGTAPAAAGTPSPDADASHTDDKANTKMAMDKG